MRRKTRSSGLSWVAALVWANVATAAAVEVGSIRSSFPTNAQSVWAELGLLNEAVEMARHGYKRNNPDNHNNDRKLQFRTMCNMVIELFDDLAPENDNRECDCNLLASTLYCKYNLVTCQDKVLPSMDIQFDLGVLQNTQVEICQEFEQPEFEPVCIKAELQDLKYQTCSDVTMGGTQCSCDICEGGLELQVDCTDHHPLAKTNGCQRVFFQDSCLDFTTPPPPSDNNSTGLENVGIDITQNATTDTNTTIQLPDEGLVVARSGGGFVSPTASPTVEGTTDGTFEGTASVTQDNYEHGAYMIIQNEDIESPYERATAWAKADPNFANYPSSKRLQRFALAALYYATTAMPGLEWHHSEGWISYSVDDCDWYTNSSEYPCNSTTGELKVLDLRENGLYGSLPPEIGYLRSLEYIALQYNFLSGYLPSEIGLLSNLVEIDVDESDIGGPLPTEIGNLQNLEALSLQYNWFEGLIPSELGLLTNTYLMELHGNSFTGSVPKEVCDLILIGGTEVRIDCEAVNCTCGCLCNEDI